MSDTEREYTPTTQEVRDAYAQMDGPDRHEALARQFDRWLAEHDAQVRAEERERNKAEVDDAIIGLLHPEFGTIWREGDGEVWLAIQRAVTEERERIADRVAAELDAIEERVGRRVIPAVRLAFSTAARIAREGGQS